MNQSEVLANCTVFRTVSEPEFFKYQNTSSNITSVELVPGTPNACGVISFYEVRVSFSSGSPVLATVSDGNPPYGVWDYEDFNVIVRPYDGGAITNPVPGCPE